jgi:tetratricopeptide (TPR) repeat protein
VLESPAMFRAYGLERSQSESWSGEHVADSTTATSDQVLAEQEEAAAVPAEPAKGGLASSGGGPALAAAPPMGAPAPAARAKAASGAEAPADMMDAPFEAKREASRPTIARDDDRPPNVLPSIVAPPRPRPRMIPMKRVWDRKGDVSSDVTRVHAQDLRAIDAAERAAGQNPDNRSRIADLYKAYAAAGRLERASDVAEKWSARDPLDPDALLARSDLAARMGDRERAIRILGSIVDVRPADPVAQTRLADLNLARGQRGPACAHRMALASLRASDAVAVAAAVRCAREEGMSAFAERLLGSAQADTTRRAIDKELAKTPAGPALRGDVRIEASWDAGADLDLALVSPSGQRYAWIGTPKGAATVTDATGRQSEAIGVPGLAAGTYLVEVVRSDGRKDPVHGTVTARAVGQSRAIAFTLTGDRVEIGQVRVYYESRLVPL